MPRPPNQERPSTHTHTHAPCTPRTKQPSALSPHSGARHRAHCLRTVSFRDAAHTSPNTSVHNGLAPAKIESKSCGFVEPVGVSRRGSFSMSALSLGPGMTKRVLGSIDRQLRGVLTPSFLTARTSRGCKIRSLPRPLLGQVCRREHVRQTARMTVKSLDEGNDQDPDPFCAPRPPMV